jgi:hypothetical protein
VGKGFKFKDTFIYFAEKIGSFQKKSRVYVLRNKSLRQLFVDEKNKARENDVGDYTIRIFVIRFLS